MLKRSFSAAGANKQFVNGSPITLQGLKKLGDILVDVHGPHDHQSLLQPEKQMPNSRLLRQAASRFATNTTKPGKNGAPSGRQREALQMSETERAMKLEILQLSAQRNRVGPSQAGRRY